MQYSCFVYAACFALVLGQTPNPERSATVRLVGGLNRREGIVLITYDGQEGKLCDNGFDDLDAAVICRMLGFTGEARTINNEQTLFRDATNLTNYILSDLDCDGSEPTIADCKKGFWLNTDCTRKNDEVAVTCLGEEVTISTTTPRPTSTTTLPPQICEPGELPSEDVRLVGGSNVAEGRVEVKREDGSWGSVCDDSWGLSDAQVVCRMLCYNPVYSLALIGPDLYGNSTTEIYLDDVKCRGNESSILDCAATKVNHDCDLDEPASVSCLRAIPTPIPAPQPELDCSNDHITAKFDRLKEPDLREAHISLVEGIDENCGYTKSTDANFIIMSIPFAGCDTNKEKTNSTHITYTNVIRHEVPPASSVISRDTIFNIEVSCIMPRDPDPELSIEPQDPVALPIDGTGDFRVVMNLFSDQSFRTVVQPFPAKVTVGDWVYVGVTLSSADNSLRLVVPECWATPTNDPNAEPKYYFIEQKCRVEPSVFFYSFNETMFAFRFQSFKFLGNNQSFVYVHCKSFICNQSEKDDDCDRTCNAADLSRLRGKRSLLPDDNRKRLRNGRSISKKLYETDKGPLIVVDQIQNIEKQIPKSLELSKDTEEVVAGRSSGLVATLLTYLLTKASIIHILFFL